MYKINTLKKSIKPLMIFSVIATVLIAAMGSTTTMNANAFNFGLKSNDVNSGSIDTDSLFSCVGAAITCTNSNHDNNNVVSNNTTTIVPVTPGPGPGPDLDACALCLTAHLETSQINALALLLDLSDVTIEDICMALEGETAASLIVALTDPSVGLDTLEAEAVIECLIEAGFTNLVA